MNKLLKILTLTVCLNCLVVVSLNADDTVVEYAYDAAGNRISRQLMQQRSCQSQALPQTIFNVYPTIVTDVINVTTQDEISPNEFRFTITNVSGNIVLSGNIQMQKTQIPVSLLPGYYILNIFSATEQYSFNLLKN